MGTGGSAGVERLLTRGYGYIGERQELGHYMTNLAGVMLLAGSGTGHVRTF